MKIRNLIVVLGDQLSLENPALQKADPDQDAVWMAEVQRESTHVWSHKARIALFLSAMRHFREALKERDWTVLYQELDGEQVGKDFEEALRPVLEKQKPSKVIFSRPGEWRVREILHQTFEENGIAFEELSDSHFICTLDQFYDWAEGRKELRLEYFYRMLRKKHAILMDGENPEGGSWNYDKKNRETFSSQGPGDIPPPLGFQPDELTQEVLALVDRQFPDHPGSLDEFNWPVTSAQAEEALDDFLENRLADFGDFQDAMWSDEPYLYHSRISASLNLKLLDPLRVIQAAEKAYREKGAPLNAVEGFIRQILGWREYVRGIYWRYMPEYLKRNELKADRALPEFYWTGKTDMHCLEQTIGQTLKYGYAHHIQRLMVTGLYALLLGVDPREVHKWYLAVYVDAVEWVELPNTLGMSQYADGGLMASKPYSASGNYIQRMSNYCSSCPYNPQQAVGDEACPFTTLYWDFLARHREKLDSNPRMNFQMKNLERKSSEELSEIREKAANLRDQVT